jgi:hypothetical protein
MQKLTAEGRFEAGIDGIVAGKVWAFVAAYPPRTDICGLGIAIANEPGFYPVPLTWANGTFDEMSDHADELNLAEGLNIMAATKIVLSSMRQAWKGGKS